MATIEQAMGQIEALEKRWNSNSEVRERAECLEQMARGSWGHKIRKMPHEPTWHARKEYRGRFAPNFLGQALKELSYLYDEEPARTMESDAEQAWANEHVWTFGVGLSVAMAEADTSARLHGTALLYPLYKPHEDAARTLRAMIQDGAPLEEMVGEEDDEGDAGIEFVCVPRQYFELLPNSFDRRHVEAAVVWMGTRHLDATDDMHAKNTRTVDVWHYWDREYFAVLYDWHPQPLTEDGDKIIPHGMLDHPLVTVRNTLRSRTCYGQPFGGTDLWENMLQVGSLWREYGWTGKLSRGQPTVNGGELKDFPGMSPDVVWEINTPGASANILQPANINGLRQCVLDHQEILAETMGLSKRAMRLDEQSSMSGVAIAMDRAELEDDRRTRVKLARMWERAVHRKAAMMWSAAKGASVSGRMGVIFRPLPQVLSFEERRQRAESLHDRGLMSDEDMLREFYPDLTDEEVEKRLKRAKAQREERRQEEQAKAESDAERQTRVNQASQPQDPLAAILGPAPAA